MKPNVSQFTVTKADVPLPTNAGVTLGTADWQFAVSGDSRNCGDVVMPTIASSALHHGIAFYWHLGDFRFFGIGPSYNDIVDEDICQAFNAKPCGVQPAANELPEADYRGLAWNDFIANQLTPFGATPIFLGIGNHELYQAKTTEQSRKNYERVFSFWLNRPEVARQRQADHDTFHTYYHWHVSSVDFINLDNADEAGFDREQLRWLQNVLDHEDVSTIVVGMHRALPNSWGCAHSMNGDHIKPDDPQAAQKRALYEKSTNSGREASRQLLIWKNKEAKREVYVVASHSHFYMEDVFNTPYWRGHNGVLQGWIIGTAGARRYNLPDRLPPNTHALTDVAGYLLGTVHDNGTIEFTFQRLNERDVPSSIIERFGKDFVHACFMGNHDATPHPLPESCDQEGTTDGKKP